MFFRNLTIRIAKSISKLLPYKFSESADLYLAKTKVKGGLPVSVRISKKIPDFF